MATLDSKFRTFMTEIRPTNSQRDEMMSGHRRLRSRLKEDDDLKAILVTDFLQGSYKRSTAIRPKADKRSDVDVVVVTNLDEDEFTPEEAQKVFHPFLERHYKDKWEPQGRSLAITLSAVDLDLVVTSTPSEVVRNAFQLAAVRSLMTPDLWLPVEESETPEAVELLMKAAAAGWQTEPLRIPDRDAQCWQPTNPLEQIRWTFEKNRNTNGHYVNVVKALKWWRRVRHPEPERPKSYPLEHIIGNCCPDGIDSVAEGLCRTLEEIRDRYDCCAQRLETPVLKDRGTDLNVLARIAGEDFADFHAQAAADAELARKAYDEADDNDSARLWVELLGTKFPGPDEDDKGSASGSSSSSSGRFAAPSGPAAPSRRRFA